MIDTALIDVLLDLHPGFLQQPVALRPGVPLRLSGKSETNGVWLPRQDHYLELLDPLSCF